MPATIWGLPAFPLPSQGRGLGGLGFNASGVKLGQYSGQRFGRIARSLRVQDDAWLHFHSKACAFSHSLSSVPALTR